MNLANVYWQCKRGLPLDQSYDCGGDGQRVIKEFPLRYFGRGRVITWTKQEWLALWRVTICLSVDFTAEPCLFLGMRYGVTVTINYTHCHQARDCTVNILAGWRLSGYRNRATLSCLLSRPSPQSDTRGISSCWDSMLTGVMKTAKLCGMWTTSHHIVH